MFHFLAVNQNKNILSDSNKIKFSKNYLFQLKNEIENNNIANFKFQSIFNISNDSRKEIYYQKVTKLI
jgi:hypothetical protein